MQKNFGFGTVVRKKKKTKCLFGLFYFRGLLNKTKE